MTLIFKQSGPPRLAQLVLLMISIGVVANGAFAAPKKSASSRKSPDKPLAKSTAKPTATLEVQYGVFGWIAGELPNGSQDEMVECMKSSRREWNKAVRLAARSLENKTKSNAEIMTDFQNSLESGVGEMGGEPSQTRSDDKRDRSKLNQAIQQFLKKKRIVNLSTPVVLKIFAQEDDLFYQNEPKLFSNDSGVFLFEEPSADGKIQIAVHLSPDEYAKFNNELDQGSVAYLSSKLNKAVPEPLFQCSAIANANAKPGGESSNRFGYSPDHTPSEGADEKSHAAELAPPSGPDTEEILYNTPAKLPKK